MSPSPLPPILANNASRRVRFGGFSLIEVVVALAILLILASVVAPSLISYLDKQRVEGAVARLTVLANGIYDNTGAKMGFYQKVGAHPGKLSQLTNQIANNPAVTDLCNNTFSNGEVNNWNNNAPFVNFYIDPSGLQTGVGVANDQLTRVNIGVWTSRIDIPNATLEDAIELDATGDTGNGQAAGYVRWVGAATPVTIQVYVPIIAAC